MRFVPAGAFPRKQTIGGTRWRRLVLGFLLSCTGELAAGSGGNDAAPEKRPPLPEFRSFGLVPEVRQAMVEFGIYLEDEPAPSVEKADHSGDLVVLLGTLTDEEKVSRWVIQLRSVPLPDTVPPAPAPVERYSSTGSKRTLSGRTAAIEVTVLRPLARRKTTNVLLANEDALNAGMWSLVSAMQKQKANPEPAKAFLPEFGDSPFPDERVQADRALVRALGMTPDEEWSREMTLPAMNEFLSLIVSTPELLTMMARVADVPLLAVMGGAREATIAILPHEATMPASQLGFRSAETAYVLPAMVLLGKRPILLCQLALVPPRPPLQVGAGLIGLAAGHPDGKGPRLTLELISASPAK